MTTDQTQIGSWLAEGGEDDMREDTLLTLYHNLLDQACDAGYPDLFDSLSFNDFVVFAACHSSSIKQH